LRPSWSRSFPRKSDLPGRLDVTSLSLEPTTLDAFELRRSVRFVSRAHTVWLAFLRTLAQGLYERRTYERNVSGALRYDKVARLAVLA
jgi:hypothetical protein